MSETASDPPDPKGADPEGQPPGGDRGRAQGRRRNPLGILLRLVLGTAVRILLLVLLLLGLVLGTQTGLRTAVAIAEELIPDMVRVGTVEGRVLGDLHLQDIEIHLPGLDLTLGSFDLEWSPFGALFGTLTIGRIAARDLDLILAPSEDKEKEPLALPEIRLPLAIEIQEALVERLQVRELGAEAPLFGLDRAALAASANGSEAKLLRLEAELPQPRLVAKAQGRVELTERYPLGLDLEWSLRLPAGADLRGEGRIGGDLARLSIEHRVEGAVRLSLDAHAQDVLSRPSWDAAVRLSGLDLPKLAPGAPDIDLTGRLETQGNLDAATLKGRLEGKAPDLPDFGRLEADLDLEWKDRALDLRTLSLTESVSGADLDLAGRLDLAKDPPSFKAEGHWERLRWPLTGEPLAESPGGRLSASGTFDAYDYALSAQIKGPSAPPAEIALKGSGNAQGTRIAGLDVRALGGTLSGDGQVAWAPEVEWDLRLRGQDLNPEALAPGIADRIGLDLETKGGLKDGYGFDLAATTRGPGLPPARLALGGSGDLKGVRIDSLRLEGLDGRMDGRAAVAWDPQVEWQAELTARDLNPGVYAKEWPGRIGGRIATQGTLGKPGDPQGRRIGLNLDGIEGVLRGYPVAATGQVRVEGESIRIEGLRASSGPTEARVNGTVSGETLDLDFALESPDLASLVPDARGRVRAVGQASGSLKTPDIELDLSAQGVEVAGQGIGSLEGRADLALTPEGPFGVRLDGKDLKAGGLTFETLSLRGDGDMRRHRLTAAVRGKPLSVRLEADGSLAADRAYQGSLTVLDVDSDAFGQWRLQRSAPVELAGERVVAGPLCIRNARGSGGCIQAEQTQAGRWSAAVDLDRLGAELVADLLPPDLSAEGAATVKGRFEAAGAVLRGSAVAAIPEGRLRLAVPDLDGGSEPEVIDVSGTRLSLDAGEKGIEASLALPVARLAQASANLSLPGWRLDAPARPDQPLRGALRARVDGLPRIARLFPQVTNVSGTLEADLTLGGTLARPDLKGQTSATGLGAQVPLIGLRVTNGNLRAVARADGLDLQGEALVGGGRLTVSGNYRPGPGGGSGEARIQGERLTVANSREFYVVVKPSFDIRLAPSLIRVTGEVVVPEARIRPREIPAGTVRASPDVVMVGKAREEKPPLPVEIDVRLKLGQNVTIDAFGVRGRLQGDLGVLKSPGRDQLLGDGQLGIVDGIYRLSAGFGLAAELGAPLTIEQGRLVYAKSPIDNPGLLLQAEREGGDMTAGVRVLGTIRDPKLAFFSESDPALSQSEITKYLLTGVPPGRDTGRENSSLSLGTYVSPKLYVEYENGLGNEKDNVKLRYDLTRHIELQTETGESQGGDIFYSFER